MSNVLILYILIDFDIWSLKGKVLELYMIMRFMDILY